MDFYNQSYSIPYDNDAYYNQTPYETQYYDQSPYSYSYSYYPPDQSSANFYSYEYQPTQSLIAYSACDDVGYANSGSVQYSVYHSIAAPPLDDDLDFPEYDPHPYKGGYDIDQTYGKPLPPSDQICYPPPSISLNLPTPLAIVPVPQEQKVEEEDDDDEEEEEEEEEELPVKEEAKDLRIQAPVAEKGEESEGSDEESDEGSEDSAMVNDVVEERDYGKVVDQMPAGYGLEAYDLCENLFGYWPCLSKMKMKKKCGECGNEIGVNYGGNDVDEWKRAADYFFGNPDPYKGSTDQGGCPSGYGYDQMQYQYQPTSALVIYHQPHHQYAHNTWFP